MARKATKTAKITYPFRALCDLTDDEIKSVVADLYESRITDIERDRANDEVCVTVFGEWGEREIEDVLHLTSSEIWTHDFAFDGSEQWRYKQHLFALGCNPLAQDNPFL